MTQGISFWSEPFFIANRNGTEVAIVLCDSQGLFDDRTPTKINSFIFGFSAVIPSLLIYNLKDHIDENALDNLATFAPKMGTIGSFQHVMFLIRDWNDDETHPLGSGGGDQYLDAILTDRDSQQMNGTRANIGKYFPSKSGFLLPPPGTHVERSKSGPADISKIDEIFLTEFDQLCRKIFVDDVHIKTNGNGEFMSSSEILAFSTHLVKMYQGWLSVCSRLINFFKFFGSQMVKLMTPALIGKAIRKTSAEQPRISLTGDTRSGWPNKCWTKQNDPKCRTFRSSSFETSIMQ